MNASDNRSIAIKTYFIVRIKSRDRAGRNYCHAGTGIFTGF